MTIKDIFAETSLSPEMMPGGYPILHPPIPDSYRAEIGEPDYKGEYELLLDFFARQTNRQIRMYTTIAEVVASPPESLALVSGFLGFNPTDYAELIATAVHKIDPDRTTKSAMRTAHRRLDSLEHWADTVAGDRDAAFIQSRNYSRVPDGSRIGWGVHRGGRIIESAYSREAMDGHLEAIAEIRGFISFPQLHTEVTDRFNALAAQHMDGLEGIL